MITYVTNELCKPFTDALAAQMIAQAGQDMVMSFLWGITITLCMQYVYNKIVAGVKKW